jgi:Na+-driven multidrug efflux pump
MVQSRISCLIVYLFLASLTSSVCGFTARSLPPVHRRLVVRREENLGNESIENAPEKTASKREMMKFAIPALGIYLANPLLSNIDNAFVGKTVGTAGLAALSPATICTDQMLYLFSFLSRATTGLVSRAYAATDGTNGDSAAARKAASAPFTVSLVCGVFLSIMYALFTQNLLAVLDVNPSLRSSAASYIHWRGAIAWAALAQSVSLSVMMATRDAITPLKIIGLASLLNVIGDYLLCVWPLRTGCAGAAAATSAATLFSSAVMFRALKAKNLLPKIQWPTRKEMSGLLEFTGPLLAITLTRLAGFIAMQKSAMTLGVQPLAAYQLCINLLIFFLLFGEPLSQLSQTKLPALIDADDGPAIVANLKSVLTLAAITALGVGGVAYGAIAWGSGVFSSDAGVKVLALKTAPSVFCAVSTAIFTVAVDGAMLASRDFGFMLLCGLSTFILQLGLLKSSCDSLSFVFGTFTMRLGVYAILALGRAALGYGVLGRIIRKHGLRGARNVA